MARLSIGLSGLSLISFQSLRLDVHGELVGIEGGPAHHGQHLAGARIERHHRAVLPVHGQFGDRLQVQVDGELQVLAREPPALFFELLAHLPAIIHHHVLLAVHAHQRVVVLPLDAEFADHRAGFELGELGESRVPPR